MQENKFTKVLDIVCRWFVGLVFLFSSFVKGVDPLGTSYKITEYMTAWSLGSVSFEWATPLATFLSVTLISVEFLVGVLIITGAWRKLGAWLLLLMMLFFTGTTLIDAVTNKVTDCGCFGDAIKLTNWQTFGKNIILDVPMIVIFLCRKWQHKPHFERDTLIGLLAVIAMMLFCLWNIKNEPCIDFRPWKVGKKMIPYGENSKVQSFVTYRDKKTGKTEEMSSEKLMEYYKDTNWTRTHEFVDSRVEDPYEIKADGFSMVAPDGEDYAKDIIGSSDYVVIATIHHLDKMDAKGIRALQRVHSWCEENGINFVLLTSALPEDIESFLYENKMSTVIYYFADTTAIETMLRSNPGFVLLKEAKVLGKWSVANANKVMDYDFEIE
jgi:uncharacterized membrane protein YphA (DoxX/SURF4 family)